MIGFKVQEDTPITGKTMKELGSSLTKKFLLGIIDKGDRTIIPSGDDIINKDDIIYFPVKKWEVADALALLGISAKPPKRIMLLGGGRIGYYIASAMELKTDVKIIEKDTERCKFLSRKLKKALVLHGDGADQQLLVEEYISDMDIFVAVSNNEELNIMASLLAKKLGVQKTIAIVNRMDYIPLAHSLGLQAVLSPRLITASSILRYVRRGDILALTTIAKGNVEVIEARVGKTSQLAGKSLKAANLPKAALIGTIIRGDKIIIPSGDDTIEVDDKLIIFTLRESIKKIEKILIG